MRCKAIISLVIPLLMLSLLGGCLGPEYLMTQAPREPSALEETASLRDASLRDARLRYTSHPEAAVRSEIVSLSVTDSFSLYERSKILRGINEWNVALNGFVRFEIMPAGSNATTRADAYWVIT